MKLIFARMGAAGLKFNAPKFSFGLNDIPYLGYVITTYGIKPGLKSAMGHRS